ncbi:MAG: hypothetical protein F7C36_07350 [Desulfurococcales archaeon]|nr:hypothetical protein [Desulfurococcales archaeon]
MSEIRIILKRIKEGEDPATVLASIKDPEKRRLYTYLLASQGKYRIVKPKVGCDCSKCPFKRYCTLSFVPRKAPRH